MASPTPAYDAALLPLGDDPSIRRKTMFGLPCAFVGRQMFFGTFGDGWVARIGPERVAELAGQPGVTVFTPTEGQPWDDYVALAPPIADEALAAYASEALAWTRALPPAVKRKKDRRG